MGGNSTVNLRVPPRSMVEMRLITGKPTRGGEPNPQWDAAPSTHLASAFSEAVQVFTASMEKLILTFTGTPAKESNGADPALRLPKRPMNDYLAFCDINSNMVANTLIKNDIKDYRMFAFVTQEWLVKELKLSLGHSLSLSRLVFAFGNGEGMAD